MKKEDKIIEWYNDYMENTLLKGVISMDFSAKTLSSRVNYRLDENYVLYKIIKKKEKIFFDYLRAKGYPVIMYYLALAEFFSEIIKNRLFMIREPVNIDPKTVKQEINVFLEAYILLCKEIETYDLAELHCNLDERVNRMINASRGKNI